MSQTVKGPCRSHLDYGLRVSCSRSTPFFSPHWSQMAGRLSLGPSARQKAALPWSEASLHTTGVKLHFIQQVPSVNTHAALASESQDPVMPDPCCGEGSHSPFHLDPTPIISPLLTQSNQRPTVTFKTGWLALLFLAVGTIEFIRKYR